MLIILDVLYVRLCTSPLSERLVEGLRIRLHTGAVCNESDVLLDFSPVNEAVLIQLWINHLTGEKSNKASLSQGYT